MLSFNKSCPVQRGPSGEGNIKHKNKRPAAVLGRGHQTNALTHLRLPRL